MEHNYNIFVNWSNKNNSYIAKIPTLSIYATDGQTIEEAIQKAKDAIEEWLEYAYELGWDIPPDDPATIESTNPTGIDVMFYIQNKLGNSVSEEIVVYLVGLCNIWCQRIYRKKFSEAVMDITTLYKSYHIRHKFSPSEQQHIDHIIETYGKEDVQTLQENLVRLNPYLLSKLMKGQK